MTRFPDQITIGDKYRPAMEIEDAEQARAYFEACVEHCMRFGKTREEAERIERINLGYFAGYYSSDVGQRVLRLYGAAHPIFGTSRPSAEEALEAGKALGAALGPTPTPEEPRHG